MEVVIDGYNDEIYIGKRIEILSLSASDDYDISKLSGKQWILSTLGEVYDPENRHNYHVLYYGFTCRIIS